MQYLFFDIECANCFEGKGKICSFGYVLTDENFEILEKEDLIINPRARFYLTGRKGDDIQLAYPQSVFRHAPAFPAFYDCIRDIITTPEQLVIGHAVSNDVKFLIDECERYNLPHFDYPFYDTQKIYREFKQIKNQVALDHILADFGITPDDAILHKSDDDALMTMWSARALCQATGLSLPELIAAYPRCAGQALGGVMSLADVKRFSESQSNRMRHANLRMFLGFLDALYDLEPTKHVARLEGKKIFFPQPYEAEHFRQMVLLCHRLAQCGATYCAERRAADFWVTLHTPKSPRHLAMEELLSLLELDETAIETEKIDVDKIFEEVGAKSRPAPKRKHRRRPKKDGNSQETSLETAPEKVLSEV